MTKKTNHKKSKNRRKSNKKNFNLINVLIALIIILLITIALLYIFEKKNLESNLKNETKKVTQVIKKDIEKKVENVKYQFEEYTDNLYEEYVDKEIIEKLKTQIENIQKQDISLNNKPKLAIVMDDITTSVHLKKIKELGYKITPALLPPTSRHPNSAKIAKNEDFYIIHFPLQAMTYSAEETNTLYIDDSYETIEKRVSELRKLYPNAKYVNNHTGSKFTANKEAMKKLFKALIKYDFIFIDSRTTGKSVVKEVAKEFNMPYISRNVFLDNEQNFDYIQNQLKKAIKIAKKNGYSIAICHPHSITFKVLSESKHLFKDLELIYLNQLSFLGK